MQSIIDSTKEMIINNRERARCKNINESSEGAVWERCSVRWSCIIEVCRDLQLPTLMTSVFSEISFLNLFLTSSWLWNSFVRNPTLTFPPFQQCFWHDFWLFDDTEKLLFFLPDNRRLTNFYFRVLNNFRAETSHVNLCTKLCRRDYHLA